MPRKNIKKKNLLSFQLAPEFETQNIPQLIEFAEASNETTKQSSSKKSGKKRKTADNSKNGSNGVPVPKIFKRIKRKKSTSYTFYPATSTRTQPGLLVNTSMDISTDGELLRVPSTPLVINDTTQANSIDSMNMNPTLLVPQNEGEYVWARHTLSRDKLTGLIMASERYEQQKRQQLLSKNASDGKVRLIRNIKREQLRLATPLHTTTQGDKKAHTFFGGVALNNDDLFRPSPKGGDYVHLSFILFLFQDGFSINSEERNFQPYSRENRAFLEHIDAGLIPPFLNDDTKNAQSRMRPLFYSGGLICEVRDYRGLASTQRKPRVDRLLLLPHTESVKEEIDHIFTHKFTDDIMLAVNHSVRKRGEAARQAALGIGSAFEYKTKKQKEEEENSTPEKIAELKEQLVRDLKIHVEQEILTRTSPQLVLDPSPKVHQLVNQQAEDGAARLKRLVGMHGRLVCDRQLYNRHDPLYNPLAELCRKYDIDMKSTPKSVGNITEDDENINELIRLHKTPTPEMMLLETGSTRASAYRFDGERSGLQILGRGYTPDPTKFLIGPRLQEQRNLPAGTEAQLPTVPPIVPLPAETGQEAEQAFMDGCAAMLPLANYLNHSAQDRMKAHHNTLLADPLFRRTIFSQTPITPIKTAANSGATYYASSGAKTPTSGRHAPAEKKMSAQLVSKYLGKLGAGGPDLPPLSINTKLPYFQPQVFPVAKDVNKVPEYAYHQYFPRDQKVINYYDIYVKPTESKDDFKMHSGQYVSIVRIMGKEQGQSPSTLSVKLSSEKAKSSFLTQFKKTSILEGKIPSWRVKEYNERKAAMIAQNKNKELQAAKDRAAANAPAQSARRG